MICGSFKLDAAYSRVSILVCCYVVIVATSPSKGVLLSVIETLPTVHSQHIRLMCCSYSVEQYKLSGFNGILAKPFVVRDVKAAVAFCAELNSHVGEPAAVKWFSNAQ